MSLNSNVGENQNIPLYSQTSNDWGNKGESNYAVNLDVGINEYIFGRTTPNNDFIVSTGLVNDSLGIKMVGNGKILKKKESKSVKPIKKESKPIKKESKPIKKESKPIKKESKPIKKESKSVKLIKKESKPVKPIKKESKPVKLIKKESKPVKPIKKESKPVKSIKKESKPVKPIKKESEGKKINLENKVKKFFKNSKDKMNKIIKKIVLKK